MRLLNSIEVRGPQQRRVELYQGDLTYVLPSEAFDLLVVSAFPDDYTPTITSLIGALHRQGLSVQRLSTRKDVDLRRDFSCWLSREFKPEDPNLRFRRILCFEPLVRGRPPELVGEIFQALTPMLAERPDIKRIALPVVAAGDQGHAVDEMLTPLLDAALHWLEAGLPLDSIKIVVRSDGHAQIADRLFSEKKLEYLRSSSAPKSQQMDYDVFISYSRANASESQALERALRHAQPGIRLFVDRNEINIGSAWQPQIFENLDRCRKVAALLSPDYVGSRLCENALIA